MILWLLVLILTIFSAGNLRAGEAANIDTTFKRPILDAVRVTGLMTLDGKLTEKEWNRAGITNFTQRDPNEGKPSSERTEVWVAYDDAAIYVAAKLYDKPDSIISRLGRRDSYMDADFFYFAVDAYHDKRTGYYFCVYPSGSVFDGTLYNDSWEDNSWDGVWDAATNLDDDGWTVEMKIPYSQLRFPKQDQYVWGVNFGRQIIRNQESSYFVMVPKKESGWVSRFADLQGIKDINPPLRFEFLPYIVSRFSNTNRFDPQDPLNKSTLFSNNMGADVKLGLGSNLTLNAAFNPDFGQVEVDPAVVNLTQFETFFSEKRPFFIEGSNLFDFGYGGANNNWGFNWGSPQFFYSRRIGRAPYNPGQHDGYNKVPDNTTILGAGKITGKLGDNFSIGALAALTKREYVHIEDEYGNRFDDVAEPFTTYSVIRGQNEFNQGKQAIGFIGTVTARDLNQPYLESSRNKSALSFGVDGWTNLDSSQTWVVTGWGAATRVEGTKERITKVQTSPLHYYQRPDADHLDVDSNATQLSGYAARFALNKQQGNFKFNSALGFISPGFESNDLGFSFRTDVINWHIVSGYRWYEPDGFFRNKGFNIATFRSFDFDGNRIGEGYFMFYSATFMNFWSVNGNFSTNRGVLDRTATRGGPWIKTTNSYFSNINVGTDSRNNVVAYLYLDGSRSESGGFRYSFSPYVQFKPSSNISMSFGPSYTRDVTRAQWVDKIEDPTATNTYGTRYLFGTLDQHELSSDIRLDWTFTPKMSLQLYIQPLISVGAYDHFRELKEPREYSFTEYADANVDYDGSEYTVYPEGRDPGKPNFSFSNPDFNFKSLRGNAVLRWEYLPGSTMYVVWTRNGTHFENPGDFSFGRDFRHLLTAPDHEDVFLIKLAYWITP